MGQMKKAFEISSCALPAPRYFRAKIINGRVNKLLFSKKALVAKKVHYSNILLCCTNVLCLQALARPT